MTCLKGACCSKVLADCHLIAVPMTCLSLPTCAHCCSDWDKSYLEACYWSCSVRRLAIFLVTTTRHPSYSCFTLGSCSGHSGLSIRPDCLPRRDSVHSCHQNHSLCATALLLLPWGYSAISVVTKQISDWWS